MRELVFQFSQHHVVIGSGIISEVHFVGYQGVERHTGGCGHRQIAEPGDEVVR